MQQQNARGFAMEESINPVSLRKPVYQGQM
jgi:hypothetical protein